MKKKERRSNLETLFGVKKIPGTDQVRNILDNIEPKELYGAFDRVPGTAGDCGVLESYRVLGGTMPVALDGTWYFSSNDIYCEHCLTRKTKKRDGSEGALYYHEMVNAVAVKPGSPVVVLPP